MIPSGRHGAPHLTDVLPDSLRLLRGEPNPFSERAVRRVIVLLVDGLGAEQIGRYRGHLRTLAPRLRPGAVIDTGAMTTTSVALTSLTTGAPAGRHGLIGYSGRESADGGIVNFLTGWDASPRSSGWLRVPPLFPAMAQEGIRPMAVGKKKFERSGLSRAILDGVGYVAADSIAALPAAALRAARSADRSLVYAYVDDLDKTGHNSGSDSDDWVERAEGLDRAVAELAAGLGESEALLLVSDHGMVDVTEEGHRRVDRGDELMAGVELVGGEPRLLHLYLRSGVSAQEVAAAWSERFGAEADAVLRERAVADGWFGADRPDDAVLPRIGEVLIAAREAVSFHCEGEQGHAPVRMIGQHGSRTDAERLVPLIGFGAAADWDLRAAQ